MDEDLLLGLIGLAVCMAPVAFLGLLAWLATRRTVDPRMGQLEAELTETKLHLDAVRQRLAALEAWRASAPVAATGEQASAPVTAAVVTQSSASESTSTSTSTSTSPAISAPTSTAISAPTAPATAPSLTPTPASATSDASSTSGSSSPSPAPAPSITPTPASPPPLSSAPLPPLPPPSEEGGLERWIGVRGAAAAGAIVLAIAGFSFFEYSIEHGLIGPAMRVVLGMLVGLGCLVASEWPLRERAPVLATWLGGAGFAILYTASWAAHAVYDLVPSWAAGGLMVMVTIACALTSARRDALPTAILGLMGGFLTPLALATGEDRPIPLFSYLLLLDVGLLFLSHRKRWPVLAWLSLGGTAAYQFFWLVLDMSVETGGIGIAVVLVFALVYGAYATRAARPDASSDAQPYLAGASSTLPFLLALSFAGRDVLSDHLYVVGSLVVVLSIGGLVVAHRARAPYVSLAAAAGALGVITVWLMTHALDTVLAWELAATFVALALAFQAASERDRAIDSLATAASLVVFGGALIASVTALATDAGRVPFVTWAVLGAIFAARQGERPGRGWIGAAVGIVLVAQLFAVEVAAPAEEASSFGVLSLVLVALMHVLALVPRSAEGRLGADRGAALAAIALAFLRLAHTPSASTPIELVSGLVLALLALFAAARMAAPGWSAAAQSVFAMTAWASVVERGTAGDALLSLALLGGAVLAFAAWPALAGPRYRRDPWAWRAAALAGPLFFFSMRTAWLRALGPAAIGALPVSLAIVSLGALVLARTHGPTDAAARRTALAWPAAITAGFVTLAIPLQLSNEWLTIGWALEGAALLFLFRRIDHAGLKALATALFVAVALRLLVNPYVLGYYPRGELRLVNWIAYTYLVPAAAMIAGYVALAPIEGARLRPVEQTLFPTGLPWLARALFAAALVTVFAWINLAIVDWFASGPALSIPTDRMPARDLSISIAWAAYALVLLGLGVFRTSTGLRWTSLLLLVVTCFKVFLYDLSHLHDLYRVAALVGLAISLLAVSLLYQRFVFRKPRVPERAPEVPR